MKLQNLNQAQLAAVQAPMGATMVLAGAGTGKTRVLTNRILYLVEECGVHPSEILAITFTNKAANEMKKRLYEFECHAEYMHISTIHSFCAFVLRREAERIGRSRSFSIYDEDEKKSVLKKLVRESCDDSSSGIVDKIADGISNIKNNAPEAMVSLAQNADVCVQSELDSMSKVTELGEGGVIKIIEEYNARLKGNNAVDFDDLLYFVHTLFKNYPEVLAQYRERYRHVLIDEFQDTNRVQYEIFRMLAGDGDIFVVGDDDQSIYSWRGADAYNLMKFSKDYPNCSVYKLQQNYRSTQAILDVANDIIAQNDNRFEKTLFTERKGGVKVQTFSAYNEQDEAYFVCEQIQGLLARGATYKDFALLMRINALSFSFEQQFRRYNIPYKVFGGFKFFERKEIKDAVAYLRLVVNPYDNEAFMRVINVPARRGIGDATLSALRNLSAEYGLPVIDVISDERNLESISGAARKKLAAFYALYAELVQASENMRVADFVHFMLEKLRFRETYMQADEEERALNIDAFEQSVIVFARENPDVSLSEYLQSVSLLSDADQAEDGNYVTIATIHAVKGLEFKTVFIVGMEEGIFPSTRSTYSKERMQEERRLMYVAATRAEDRLYLTRAISRFLWGQRKKTFASMYFTQVQKFLQPPKPPATEWQLQDNAYLDKLERTPASHDGKKDVSAFKVGQVVMHQSFGRGIILNLKGDDAQIFFDNAGKKTLNLRFAPMTIVK